MQDRRKHQRHRSYIGAHIQFDSRTQTLDCLVRDIGPSGARVQFHNSTVIPDHFTMVIPHRGLRYEAHTVWRSFEMAGIAFAAPEAAAGIG